MAYDNPHITGVGFHPPLHPKQSGFFFIALMNLDQLKLQISGVS